MLSLYSFRNIIVQHSGISTTIFISVIIERAHCVLYCSPETMGRMNFDRGERKGKRVGGGGGWEQKRFIYRLLTRHDFLPVWLVADK
jgi:hypothetical protein